MLILTSELFSTLYVFYFSIILLLRKQTLYSLYINKICLFIITSIVCLSVREAVACGLSDWVEVLVFFFLRIFMELSNRNGEGDMRVFIFLSKTSLRALDLGDKLVNA